MLASFGLVDLEEGERTRGQAAYGLIASSHQQLT